MSTTKAERLLEERKRLHAEFAKRPGITEKIVEGTAAYQEARASGELRRKATPKRNGATRKR